LPDFNPEPFTGALHEGYRAARRLNPKIPAFGFKQSALSYQQNIILSNLTKILIAECTHLEQIYEWLV